MSGYPYIQKNTYIHSKVTNNTKTAHPLCMYYFQLYRNGKISQTNTIIITMTTKATTISIMCKTKLDITGVVLMLNFQWK